MGHLWACGCNDPEDCGRYPAHAITVRFKRMVDDPVHDIVRDDGCRHPNCCIALVAAKRRQEPLIDLIVFAYDDMGALATRWENHAGVATIAGMSQSPKMSSLLTPRPGVACSTVIGG